VQFINTQLEKRIIRLDLTFNFVIPFKKRQNFERVLMRNICIGPANGNLREKALN